MLRLCYSSRCTPGASKTSMRLVHRRSARTCTLSTHFPILSGSATAQHHTSVTESDEQQSFSQECRADIARLAMAPRHNGLRSTRRRRHLSPVPSTHPAVPQEPQYASRRAPHPRQLHTLLVQRRLADLVHPLEHCPRVVNRPRGHPRAVQHLLRAQRRHLLARLVLPKRRVRDLLDLREVETKPCRRLSDSLPVRRTVVGRCLLSHSSRTKCILQVE